MADTAAPTPEAAPPAPAGIKAKLPLIALIAVGLAVGGGTGAKFIGPMVAQKMGRTTTPVVAHEAQAAAGAAAEGEGGAAKDAEGKDGGKEGAASKESDAPAVHVLENLVLNPSGSGGSRFLLLTVAIETDGSKTVTEFTSRDAELRDIILTALGSKTVDQLTDIALRESIKTELQTAIGARFGKTAVKRLYFPQFVVQ